MALIPFRQGRRPWAFASLCALGCALALVNGCGTSAGSSPSATERPPATAESENATDTNEPDTTEEGTAPTLVELSGIDLFDENAIKAWMEQAEITWRRLTAECMLAEGFEYSQQDWTSPGAFVTDLASSSREYAELYGFGVVPRFLASIYDPSLDYQPPNAAYVDSLTAGEREAYNIALTGSPAGENQRSDGFPAAGCSGDAFDASFDLINQFEEVAPLAADVIARIEADPRMTAAMDQWAGCMADAGFAGLQPDSLIDTFSTRLVNIFQSGNAFEYSPDEVPKLPAPDLPMNGPSWRVLPALNDNGQAKVDALLAEETATAVAAYDCRQDIAELELAIQTEYEAEFVAENQRELEAIFSDD